MTRTEIEDLYRRYGSLVLRRARRILGDEEQARDAMQDVFARVITRYDTFRGDASPATWLYRITTNLCLNRIRDSARRRELLKANPDSRYVAAVGDTRVDVARALMRVERDLQETAVLYYVDGMDQKEIAALTGVARRTVSFRLQKFQKQARAFFDPPPPAEGSSE